MQRILRNLIPGAGFAALLAACTNASYPASLGGPEGGGYVVNAAAPGADNSGVPGTMTVMSEAGVTMIVHAEPVEGAFQTQAIVPRYTKASINHLLIELFKLDPSTQFETPVVDEAGKRVSLDLQNSQIDSPAQINNLAPNTVYRIRCFAYKAPGTDTYNLISTTDARSYTDLAIGNDDLVEVSAKVRLIDVPFSGTAEVPGVTVVEGGYLYEDGPSMGISSPAPSPASAS